MIHIQLTPRHNISYQQKTCFLVSNAHHFLSIWLVSPESEGGDDKSPPLLTTSVSSCLISTRRAQYKVFLVSSSISRPALTLNSKQRYMQYSLYHIFDMKHTVTQWSSFVHLVSKYGQQVFSGRARQYICRHGKTLWTSQLTIFSIYTVFIKSWVD